MGYAPVAVVGVPSLRLVYQILFRCAKFCISGPRASTSGPREKPLAPEFQRMPQLLRPSSPADKLRQPASLRHLKPRAQRSKTMTSHSLRVCSVVAIEPVGARACMPEGQADRMANRSVFGGCVVGPDRPLQTSPGLTPTRASMTRCYPCRNE